MFYYLSEQLPSVTMIQAGNLNIVSIGGGRVKGKVIRGRSQVLYIFYFSNYVLFMKEHLGTNRYLIKLLLRLP